MQNLLCLQPKLDDFFAFFTISSFPSTQIGLNNDNTVFFRLFFIILALISDFLDRVLTV